MKKYLSIFLLFFLLMSMGLPGFADELLMVDIPLGSKQEVLITIDAYDSKELSDILDLDYDPINKLVYVITGDKSGLKEPEESQEIGKAHQYVYDLSGNPVPDQYRLLPDMQRIGIEFVDGQVWSLDRYYDEPFAYLYNYTSNKSFKPKMPLPAKNFDVVGDQMLFFLGGCSQYNFVTGNTRTPELQEWGEAFSVPLNAMKGFAFSPDGKEILAAGYSEVEEQDEINYVIRLDSETKKELGRITLSNYYVDDSETLVFYLHATEDYIVVSRKDVGANCTFIERYTYEGELVDSVKANFCTGRITEGPNDSTLYVRWNYQGAEGENNVLEVVQINWEEESQTESGGTMHPVVSERTRRGQTVARFTDSQFGLLRAEEPETGIVDYRAPIRSEENLVKLQIPYCDMQAKCESGARNLLVEYKDQSFALPMTLFDCDDLLAAMPCQDEATIEIILKADEAGNVSYQVQLFVVEEVNGMTKLVHRKTIQ